MTISHTKEVECINSSVIQFLFIVGHGVSQELLRSKLRLLEEKMGELLMVLSLSLVSCPGNVTITVEKENQFSYY